MTSSLVTACTATGSSLSRAAGRSRCSGPPRA